MKRPLVLAFSLACCIVLALLCIGAGELEVYNPRVVQRGNTALSVWSIPVAVAGNVVSNSVITQSGSDITLPGALNLSGVLNGTNGFSVTGDSSGTNRLTYDANGLVSSNANGIIQYQGGAGLLISNKVTSKYVLVTNGSLTATGPITNSVSGGPAIVQTSATGTNSLMGPIGVGTNSPNSAMEIVSTFALSRGQLMMRTTPSEPTYCWLGAGTGGMIFGADNVTTGSGILFYVGTGVSSEKLRLTDSGKLGIMQAAPQAMLDVNGGGNFGSTAFDPGVGKVAVQYAVGIGTNSPQEELHIYSADYAAIKLQSTTNIANVFTYQTNAYWGFENNGNLGFLTANSDRLHIDWEGRIGIFRTAPLARLDIDGGLNIGPNPFATPSGGLSLNSSVTMGGSITQTNSANIETDPAATTGVQWHGTQGLLYRDSVANEGAGQINHVHNRAAQVVGVGTDYSFTQVKTNVTFGTSGGSIALPTAGTYDINCLVNFSSTTAADDLHFYLWDGTNNVIVPGSWQHHESHANNDHDTVPLTANYTVTTNVHIWIGAVNVTAARGVVVSTNTIIKYVRCY